MKCGVRCMGIILLLCVYIDDCVPHRELGSNSNKRCHTVLCNHEIV